MVVSVFGGTLAFASSSQSRFECFTLPALIACASHLYISFELSVMPAEFPRNGHALHLHCFTLVVAKQQ